MKNMKELYEWKPSEDNRVLSFCRDSTLEGVKYIGDLKSHFCERLFWVIVLALLTVAAVLSIWDVLDAYNHIPIIVSFHKEETTLDQIPFPAITLCNNNILRASVGEYIIDQYINPVNFSRSEAERLIQIAKHVCESYPQSLSTRFNYTTPPLPPDMTLFRGDFSEQDVYANLSEEAIKILGKMCCQFNGIPEAILRLQYKELLEAEGLNRNISEVLKKIQERWQSWKLDDFVERKDKDGYDMPPLRLSKAGRDSGLSILVNPELDEYYCPLQDSAGFTLLAGSPIDQPEIAGLGVGIGPNSETFVDVSFGLTVSDSKINGLPIEKRRCYFHGEFNLRFYAQYTIRNCRRECVTNITLAKCGCVKVYMAKDENTKICGSINDTCAQNVQRMMNTEGFNKECVQCIPSCTDINYSVNLSKLPMNPHKNPWKKDKYVEPWADKNLSIIHVYFGSDATYAKYHQRVYDMSSLISDVGGLLGLYFGFSLMSLFEIFYHFIFKPLFEQSEDGKYILAQKLKALKRKISQKVSNQNNDIKQQKILVKSKVNGKTNPAWSLGEIAF